MVDFKNVALNNDSDSEDEFVNIVVPLFEQADSEITKSAVKEILSRSTDLRQKAEKKMRGKRGSFCILYSFFCFSGLSDKCFCGAASFISVASRLISP